MQRFTCVRVNTNSIEYNMYNTNKYNTVKFAFFLTVSLIYELWVIHCVAYQSYLKDISEVNVHFVLSYFNSCHVLRYEKISFYN